MKPEEAARKILKQSERLIAEANSGLGPQMRRRLDGEDILMSSVRSFLRRDDIPDDEGQFWALLTAIIRNKTFKALRYHLAQCRDPAKERQPADGLSVEDHRQTAAEEQETRILLDTLQECIAALDPRDQEVISRRLEGLTWDEVAERMDLAEGYVRFLYRVAIGRLRERMLQVFSPDDTEDD